MAENNKAKKETEMNRKKMWHLRDAFLGIENGSFETARVCIVVCLLSLVAMVFDADTFSALAGSAMVTAIVSVVIGLFACKAGGKLEELCLELEFGDPSDTVDLKDWADAQMKNWCLSAIAFSVAVVFLSRFSMCFTAILVVPAAWLAYIKLVKRSACVKIRDLGTDEVEIERWRPTFESVKALKA